MLHLLLVRCADIITVTGMMGFTHELGGWLK